MTWDEGSPAIGTLFSPRVIDLLGCPREYRAPLTQHHMDVAASLQAMLEEAYLHLVRALWERTKIPRICLAGGVALNAVANGRIIPETPFEDVFIQPLVEANTSIELLLRLRYDTLKKKDKIAATTASTTAKTALLRPISRREGIRGSL